MDGATDIKAFPRTSLVEQSILPVAEKRKEKTRRYHGRIFFAAGCVTFLAAR
jgi:hypothetical protein